MAAAQVRGCEAWWRANIRPGQDCESDTDIGNGAVDLDGVPDGAEIVEQGAAEHGRNRDEDNTESECAERAKHVKARVLIFEHRRAARTVVEG